MDMKPKITDIEGPEPLKPYFFEGIHGVLIDAALAELSHSLVPATLTIQKIKVGESWTYSVNYINDKGK
ncbi:hypothetical protein [Limnobacter litoralis]|uniref:Uncharacterized protein n=1 Tax=Limnobacter litoralis TaxID=481366 RepID=A0ABQ5YUR8_9BURK|nr:hypothetical protein [Limnobacter litoralis]GLR26509.1 hypothetical protein GCM10007875_15990 [Limnobacter litoralis]